MTERDPLVRANRRRAAFLVVVALMWLVVAAWAVARGDTVEAIGHVLLAILVVAAAFLISNPYRRQVVQKRVTIGALALVPITLAIFIASIFL